MGELERAVRGGVRSPSSSCESDAIDNRCDGVERSERGMTGYGAKERVGKWLPLPILSQCYVVCGGEGRRALHRAGRHKQKIKRMESIRTKQLKYSIHTCVTVKRDHTSTPCILSKSGSFRAES